MDSLEEKLNEIDTLKKKLDELQLLDANTVSSIKMCHKTSIIYNAILGKDNTFTPQEINELLLHGNTISGKSDDEHSEIKDHKEALDYIEELASKKMTELCKIDIINIHTILFKNIAPQIAGKYRTEEIWVLTDTGEKYEVCNHLSIAEEMESFFDWLFSERNEHPVITASEAHNRFVAIHPFLEGNGRTGRLIMNLVLLQNGYKPVIIYSLHKEKYTVAIRSWRENKKMISITSLQILKKAAWMTIIGEHNAITIPFPKSFIPAPLTISTRTH